MEWWKQFWQWMGINEQFGTMGEWVGGLGTAGALLLGFKVMRLDRRERLQDQAFLLHFTVGIYDNIFSLNVTNVSQSPFSFMSVILRTPPRHVRFWHALRARKVRLAIKELASSTKLIARSLDVPHRADRLVLPSETVSCNIYRDTDLDGGWLGDYPREHLIYTDAKGQMWVMETKKRELLGRRAANRIDKIKRNEFGRLNALAEARTPITEGPRPVAAKPGKRGRGSHRLD